MIRGGMPGLWGKQTKVRLMTDALLHLEIRLHPAIKAIFAFTDKGSKSFWHLLNHIFYATILHIKIWEFYFELSLVVLDVVKSYSNDAKNACTGGTMTCNLDNHRETSILYVPNLFHCRCLQSHTTSGKYFLLYDTAGPSIHSALLFYCCVPKWEPPSLWVKWGRPSV